MERPSLVRLLLLSLGLLGMVGCGTALSTDFVPSAEPLAELDRLQHLVQERPEDGRAWAQKGVVALQLQRNEEALSALSRAMELRPRDAAIAYWLGEAHLHNDSPVDAYTHFSHAIELDSTLQEAYLADVEGRLVRKLVDVVVGGEERARAMRLVEGLDSGAVQRHPAIFAQLFESAGMARFATGAGGLAVRAFERALQTGMASSQIRLRLGDALASIRRMEEAQVHYDVWVAGAQSERSALTVALRVTSLARRFRRHAEDNALFGLAADYFAQVPATQFRTHSERWTRGMVLIELQHWADGQSFLEPLLPEASQEQRQRLLDAYAAHDQLDAAIGVLQQNIDARPEDIQAWKALADFLVQHGRQAELESLIARPDAHLRWGDLYLVLERFSDALEAYARVDPADVGGPQVWLKRGIVYGHMGQLVDRERAFQRYLSAAPDRFEATQRVAEAYEGLAALVRAEALWLQAHRQNSAHRVPVFALNRLYRSDRRPEASKRVLETWADAQSNAEDRAAAWLEIARLRVEGHRAAEASDAFARVLSEGSTSYRRLALLAAADLQYRQLSNHRRAEQLYDGWIQEAAPAERSAARRDVIQRIGNVPAFRSYRNQLLEELAQAQPVDRRTHFLLGEAYLQGRPPQPLEATRAFERYVELSDDTRSALLRAGSRLNAGRAYPEAAQFFRRLPLSETLAPSRHLELAQLYLRGRVNDLRRSGEHVRRFLDSGVEFNPALVAALGRLADQLLSRGLFSLALRSYERLLPLLPDRARTFKLMADALLGLRRLDEAEQTFERYLDARGGHVRALHEVAEAYYTQREYRRALRYYERLLLRVTRAETPRAAQLRGIFPRMVDIYRKLGDSDGLLTLVDRYTTAFSGIRAFSAAAVALELSGLVEPALSMWGRASAEQPNNPVFHQNQAKLALRLGQIQQAEQFLTAFLSTQRGLASAWVQVGEMLTVQRLFQAAHQRYDAALEAGLDVPTIARARARLFVREQRFDEAETAFLTGFTESAQVEKFLEGGIREAYTAAGQRLKYVRLLQQLAGGFPGRVDLLLEIGTVFLELNQTAEAHRSFERYITRQEAGLVDVALVLWRAGDLESARQMLDRALVRPHLDARSQVLTDLLTLLMVLGQPEEVPEALRRYLMVSTHPDRDRGQLVELLSRRGLLTLALRYASDLVAERGRADDGLRLGRLWLQAEEPARAEALFTEVLSRPVLPLRSRASRPSDPSPEWTHQQQVLSIATAYEQAGYLRHALELLEKESHFSPSVAAYPLRMARLFLREGDLLSATTALESFQQTEPLVQATPVDLQAILQLFRELGTPQEGYEILSRMAPSRRSVSYAVLLIELALRLGHRFEADQEASRLFEEERAGTVWTEVGLAYLRTGHAQAAVPYLLGALRPGRAATDVSRTLQALFTLARQRADRVAFLEHVTLEMEDAVQERRLFHENLAIAYLDTADEQRAVPHLVKWMELLSRDGRGEASALSRFNPAELLVKAFLRRGDLPAIRTWLQGAMERVADPRSTRELMFSVVPVHGSSQWARALLEEWLSVHDQDREARFLAGRSCLLSGDVDAADRHFSSYVTHSDNAMAASRRVAEGYGRLLQTERAEQWLQNVPREMLTESFWWPLMWLKSGDIERAWKEISAVIVAASDPDLARVRFAAIYLRDADMPLEMSLRLLSVLASESLHPVGQLVRVAGLAEQGRVVEVRHNLAALDARGGADEGALIRRGRGDVSDVGSRYVKNRGRVIRKAMEGGHIPLAVELLDEVASGRRSSELLLALRWVIEGLGTGEGGGQTGRASLLEAGYRYLALIEPGTVAFATRVAMEADLAEAAGDIPGSVVIYRNALARFPEVPSLHHRLAELLLRQGEDFDEASRVADQAFAINPGYASIHLATKGWCQFQHGAFSTARELLERALRHTPEASSGLAIRTLTRLSHTYRELGQPLAAEQMARRRDWLAFDRILPRRASSFD